MQELKGGQNFSHLFPPIHTCSHLFTPVHTCSYLFTTVHTSSHLFTPFHTCSHLSDYLRSLRNGSFSLNIPLTKAVIFQFYVLSCWNCIFLLTWSRAIQRYLACVAVSKKISIPLTAHTTMTMYARREMSFFALSKALILQSYVLSCWNLFIIYFIYLFIG